jgi:putative restriction endonuclease
VRLDDGFTFVDAAHLIPFNASRNDHPSNGLSLCKNHHWAMDHFLIAPTPDATWAVSGVLHAHRSPGEADLVQLHGRRLVRLPAEADFRPSAAACGWRLERMKTG